MNTNYEFLAIYHSEFRGNQPYIRHWQVGILKFITIHYN